MRPARLDDAYVVTRDRATGAVATRRATAGETTELARSGRRGRTAWTSLASAILADALDGAAGRKLSGDYARFIVTAPGGTTTFTGRELQAWLDTWRPPLAALFGSER